MQDALDCRALKFRREFQALLQERLQDAATLEALRFPRLWQAWILERFPATSILLPFPWQAEAIHPMTDAFIRRMERSFCSARRARRGFLLQRR